MFASVLFLCLFAFIGCGAENSAPDTVYCRFADSAGYEVVLPVKPEKTAVLFSSLADIWQTAGGEIFVTVGETVERGFAEEDVILADSGAGKTVNTELLLASDPDFVILSADIAAQVSAAELLRKAGIPCAVMRIESFADYLETLRIFTEITGETERYETYGTEQESEIRAILGSAASLSGEKPDILFVRAASSHSATKAKTAEQHFVCAMLDELGTHNIADEAPVLLDGLSMEAILRADPDYIFFSAMGSEEAAKAYVNELLSDEAWQSLTAVAERKYSFLPKELFHYKPNARFAEAYRYLYELLYHENEET